MMFKKTFVTLGLMSLVASGLLACDCAKGCTPGFWKTGNHVQGFQAETYVDVFALKNNAELEAIAVQVNAMVNGVNKNAYGKLPGMDDDDGVLELGEALWLKGNKDKYMQLVRTSAAAMLNIRYFTTYAYAPPVPPAPPSPYDAYWGQWMQDFELIRLVHHAFLGDLDVDKLQQDLDNYNNSVCELRNLNLPE